MAEAECEILELRLTAGGLAALLRCPAAIQPGPGQYLLGNCPECEELLGTPLFRMDAYPPAVDQFLAAPPLQPGWSVGDVLRVRGPLGRGFSLPAAARSLALAAWNAPLEPLLPLMHAGLQQGAAVAVYTDQHAGDFPLSVEVQPFNLVNEAARWADYIALHVPQADAPQIAGWFGLEPAQRLPVFAEVLLAAPMPCGGRALCGVCAQPTRRGSMLLCREGPVVDVNDLEVR